MRKVKPGDKVQLSYRRDNKVVKANLVAQPLHGSVLHDGRAARRGYRTAAAHAEFRCSCAAKACSGPRSWCR